MFQLGNSRFDFRVKHRFPKKLTSEFLCVDLLNNLDELAEDRDGVLRHARNQSITGVLLRLRNAIDKYGNMAARKRLGEWIDA